MRFDVLYWRACAKGLLALDPSTRIQLTALAFHRRVRGGGVSKLIPHPLSLVVNVNFYSCPKTAINPSLTALHVDPSTRMQRTALACHRRVRGGEVSILIPHPPFISREWEFLFLSENQYKSFADGTGPVYKNSADVASVSPQSERG